MKSVSQQGKRRKEESPSLLRSGESFTSGEEEGTFPRNYEKIGTVYTKGGSNRRALLSNPKGGRSLATIKMSC